MCGLADYVLDKAAVHVNKNRWMKACTCGVTSYNDFIRYMNPVSNYID